MRLKTPGSAVTSSEALTVDCARSDDTVGAAGAISADGRPRGARPIDGASFAAGIRIARGLLVPGGMLPQEELPSHVVVAFVLWFSELALAADSFSLPVCSLLRSF